MQSLSILDKVNSLRYSLPMETYTRIIKFRQENLSVTFQYNVPPWQEGAIFCNVMFVNGIRRQNFMDGYIRELEIWLIENDDMWMNE